MQDDGLCGVSKRRGPARPPRTVPEAPLSPDLVPRIFHAKAPKPLWIADITSVPTAAGFRYLAVALDVFSRRIIGCAMRDTLCTTVVLEALVMAASQRRATAVGHHSDQLNPPSTVRLRSGSAAACSASVRTSMGSRGNASDNAIAESCFSTLEYECLAKHRFTSHTDARLIRFRDIEGWSNPHRRHSALGQCSPLAFELHHAVATIAA